ncbi:MAG: PH domain-containing protein [Candidatus Zambryskibacteria bacterium]
MKSFLSIFTASSNSFEGEENGEKVVLLLRRHPFFILVRMFLFLFLALIPIAVGIVFPLFLYSHNLLAAFLFLSGVWYVFIWSSIFYALTMYTLDVWIVTDRRIIDSTQNGFFNRTISELHLTRIQDISVQTKGVIQTFFKFGDLQIQTAGAEEKFKFSQIPHPVKVKDEIMKLASAHSSPHL